MPAPVISPTATIVTKNNADFSSAGGTVTLAHNAGSTPASFLVVDVSWNKATTPHTITSVTYNGVAMTSLGLLSVTVSSLSGYGETFVLAARTYSGVDQVTPYSGYATGTANSGTTATVTVVSATGKLVVASFFGQGSGTLTGSPVDTETERFDVIRATNGNAQCTGQDDAGAASVSMGNTWSVSTSWRSMGISLNPSTVTYDNTISDGIVLGDTQTISNITSPSSPDGIVLGDSFGYDYSQGSGGGLTDKLLRKYRSVKF